MLIKAGFILTAAICFPEHIIKSVAYGQLVSSIVLVVSFWVFFHLEFKKKAEVLKQGELDKDSSLARLPFSSIRELLPAQIISGPVSELI